MRTSQVVCVVWLATILAAGTVLAWPAVDAKPTAKVAADVSAGIPAGELPPAVVRIEKALDEPTELDNVQNMPLVELIDYFRTRHQIEIQLDGKSLKEAGVAIDTPITRHVKNITLRSALRLVLRELELTYMIRDEVLFITTNAPAEEILQIRLYPVSDLLDRSQGKLHSDPASDLIDTITGVVAPTSWSEYGGAGFIKYLPIAESLVITQTSEIHGEVRDLLIATRKVLALDLTQHRGHRN
jgi:hypothetical protein